MTTEPIEIQLRRPTGVRPDRSATDRRVTDPRAIDAAFAGWEDSGRRLDLPVAATASAPSDLAAIVGEQLSLLSRQQRRLESLLAQIQQDDA